MAFIDLSIEKEFDKYYGAGHTLIYKYRAESLPYFVPFSFLYPKRIHLRYKTLFAGPFIDKSNRFPVNEFLWHFS